MIRETIGLPFLSNRIDTLTKTMIPTFYTSTSIYEINAVRDEAPYWNAKQYLQVQVTQSVTG